MSEIREQADRPTLSRREFLKKVGKTAAKVASGAVGLGGLGKIGQELITAYNQEARVETDKAVFLPLYESHEISIESSAIPPEADYFWDEYIIWGKDKEPFENNITSEYSTPKLIRFLDERNQSFLPYLAKNNVRLVLGDLVTPQSNKKTIIAAEVGYEHGGLEDFLRAGKEFCLALIDNLFTVHFISRTAEINLGPKSIATNRIFAFPPDFNTQKNHDDMVEFQHIDAALLSCLQGKIEWRKQIMRRK